MALWQLMAAVRRHLRVVAVGLLATVASMLVVHGWPGIYQARLDVILEASAVAPGSNPYLRTDASLIAASGAVAAMANDPRGAGAKFSDAATLAGQGVTHGYLVRLSNTGNQWVPEHRRAALVVDVVGRSEAEVQKGLVVARQRIADALDQLQTQAGSPAGERIQAHAFPLQPVVYHGTGSRSRAMAATLLVGVGVTLAVVLALSGATRAFGPVSRRRSRPVPALV